MPETASDFAPDDARCAAKPNFTPFVAPALLAVVLLVVFAPALTQFYGCAEDYPLLWKKLHGGAPVFADELTRAGRPLAGLFWASAGPSSFPHDINRLAAVRALGCVGLWLLAWAQFGHLRVRLKFSAPAAFSFSLATVLTPACALFVGWAALWMAPFACLAAYLAGCLAWQRADTARKAATWRPFGVGLLLLLALTVYPPAALFFTVAVVAELLAAQRRYPVVPAAEMARGLGRCAALFLAWISAYGLALAASLAWLPAGDSDGNAVRTAFATVSAGRFLPLLRSMLWCAATSWTRLQPTGWQVVAALFTALGILGAVFCPPRDERWRKRAIVLAGLLFAFSAAVVPTVVFGGNPLALRTLPAAFAALALVALAGWQEIAAALWQSERHRRVRKIFGMGALALPLLFVVTAARHHVLHGIVNPSHDELLALRREIRQRVSAAAALAATPASPVPPPARIVYAFPSPFVWRSPRLSPFAEFGARSSSLPAVAPALLRLLLAEQLDPHADVTGVEIWSFPTPAGERDWFINGSAALDENEGLVTRTLPRLGEVRMLPNGWCQSPWLGAFDAAPYPFIVHPQLGLLFCDQNPGKDLWLHSVRWDWLGTAPTMFPDFWLMKANARVIRLSLRLDDCSQLRCWLDPQTGAAIQPQP